MQARYSAITELGFFNSSVEMRPSISARVICWLRQCKGTCESYLLRPGRECICMHDCTECCPNSVTRTSQKSSWHKRVLGWYLLNSSYEKNHKEKMKVVKMHGELKQPWGKIFLLFPVCS